ncbi:leucine-rich repeat-containing protein 42 [Octopus sinensis]|uniref:Leucine-rich repeat-containing protein 42 n=1 Tax=Octopus sinensis TaxID=2607531 RepID=A0A6P7SBM8_9MOLL|nr:leucine-rich repeat-containing protein 42 [Octopus sinensis]XP_036358192.1 leucine-rich repeat-containing protein 42 [Octopus sinensis]
MSAGSPANCERFSWQSVPSLLSLCINFVADNLDLVESFQHFPDLLGKEIFLAAERNEQFAQPDPTVIQRLELFSKAFSTEFLQSLYLSREHLLVNYLSDDFLLFAGVQSLNLSHCGLSDDHEILYKLSCFTNLNTLSLQDNALTSRGLQKLTLPLRMFNRGPKLLKALDLSENPELTIHGIRYLKAYPLLCVLNLSNTAISKNDTKLQLLSMKVCIPEEGVSGGLDSCFRLQTEGWASNVINTWLTWYNNKSKRPRLGENSFYSKQRLKFRLTKCESYTKPRYQLILKK